MSVLTYHAPDRHADYNKGRLFIVSVLALVTAGISFSIRSTIADDIKREFLDKLDPAGAGQLLGGILGVAFLGFAITIAVGSPLLDYLGMGRLLGLSSVCFIVGTLIIICARPLSGSIRVDWVLWAGMLLHGTGWGLVETVINPLAATLYPDDKTHKLNVLHAWWPAGLIFGGLLGLAVGAANLGWQWKMAVVLVPAAVFGLMLIGSKFPPTERVAAGISAKEMTREVVRPLFIVWFLCMFLTAASELAPGQWVQFALSRTVGMQGILLLVYVGALMFVMRHFAGPVAHKLSPVGLLWVSCLLATAGLLCLSVANSPVTGILAATVWGVGVCYMWPTMLASASERFPRGGALLMGLMGTAGTLSIYFVLPQMGHVYDHYLASRGDVEAAKLSFRVVAICPAVLLLVFGAIWLHDKARGGYKPVKLTAAEELGEASPEL